MLDDYPSNTPRFPISEDECRSAFVEFRRHGGFGAA
jgi:hypothetical protein